MKKIRGEYWTYADREQFSLRFCGVLVNKGEHGHKAVA
jgi:hypothetical protein